MKKKELLDFLTANEQPPVSLKEITRKDILLSFDGRNILIRFIAFQILGALISLSFCPQFGMSFFVEGHGITHQLRMIGDWACAVFCGSLFLSTGTIIALFSMKADELWWVWRRRKFSLILLPGIFWGVLMLLNISLDLPSENYTYHLTWIMAGVLMQFLWFKMRGLIVKPIKSSPFS